LSVRPPLLALLFAAFFSCAGCANLPGRPAADAIPIDPDKITDFAQLFQENCSGCHGTEGRGGAALSIGDPVYLAIVDDSILREVVTRGIAGTSMPAFAKSAGGMLTDAQIDVIIRGIRGRYSKPNVLADSAPPPYAPPALGDAHRGDAVFAAFCASCHGPAGQGGPKAGSIVEQSFLALLTDQELRTLVIVGRPDLGAPDWRNNIPGKPMSSQEISDVVAWLSSQRAPLAGNLNPNAAKSAGALP
jgi:cytochrome c oxidase cbb3-type subunit 3